MRRPWLLLIVLMEEMRRRGGPGTRRALLAGNEQSPTGPLRASFMTKSKMPKNFIPKETGTMSRREVERNVRVRACEAARFNEKSNGTRPWRKIEWNEALAARKEVPIVYARARGRPTSRKIYEHISPVSL